MKITPLPDAAEEDDCKTAFGVYGTKEGALPKKDN